MICFTEALSAAPAIQVCVRQLLTLEINQCTQLILFKKKGINKIKNKTKQIIILIMK
jgi:hypothetical protein